MQKHRLWDLPLRLSHWSLALLVALCWWTAEIHAMAWHTYAGYGLFAVVVFRLYWGFAGSRSARFHHFLKGPGAVFRYAKTLPRRQTPPSAGHNPLGALSVIALLAACLLQVVLGLGAIDADGFDGGPFADFLEFDIARLLAQWHAWNFNLLLTLIALHLAAIFFYRVWKNHNLIAPMIHGRAPLANPQPALTHPLLRAIAGLAISIASIGLILLLPDLLF